MAIGIIEVLEDENGPPINREGAPTFGSIHSSSAHAYSRQLRRSKGDGNPCFVLLYTNVARDYDRGQTI